MVLVGCAAPADSGGTTTTADVATTTTTTAPSTTTIAVTTTQAIDPALVFSDGVAASSTNYRFVSKVVSGEETITTIEGVVDHGSIAATITVGTSYVSYIRTPEGEWIKEADGEWVAAEGEPPVYPPLTALTDATGLTVVSAERPQVVVAGQLGAAAGAAASIPFTTVLIDGLVSEIRYEAESGGTPALVTTTLSEIGTAGVVAAPEV